ncbi:MULTISPECIES: hypothetical protein [unclassified Sphingomonas]|uniref:hypothetical protein n=1 Tax=unclassified Sphingomonas TaxID=196159 RepID=UPI0006FE17B2|nr:MULTISPECIES: hypothetical protein [unclassified Sphingomonas]KQM24809.1 hypothetical protein ASE58_15565 [Sphingomonas sp. Leaf9]KQM42467.1 hypothetical protein ASE57_15565 [Sphingomonas sp. Leaf11]
MATDPIQDFHREALTLQATETLADMGELFVGDDAGAALIGAALKTWERRWGNEYALQMAVIALGTITKAQTAPNDHH